MQILKQKCEMLAISPGLGICQEAFCGFHKFPVNKYLIFYGPSKTGIEAIRILHGKPDIQAILNPEN